MAPITNVKSALAVAGICGLIALAAYPIVIVSVAREQVQQKVPLDLQARPVPSVWRPSVCKQASYSRLALFACYLLTTGVRLHVVANPHPNSTTSPCIAAPTGPPARPFHPGGPRRRVQQGQHVEQRGRGGAQQAAVTRTSAVSKCCEETKKYLRHPARLIPDLLSTSLAQLRTFPSIVGGETDAGGPWPVGTAACSAGSAAVAS